MADADVTVEGSYGVPAICHQCLESHGLVAEWDKDGGLDRVGLDAGRVPARRPNWPGTSRQVQARSAGQQGQVHHALHGRRFRQQVRPRHPGHRRRRAGAEGQGARQAHARSRQRDHGRRQSALGLRQGQDRRHQGRQGHRLRGRLLRHAGRRGSATVDVRRRCPTSIRSHSQASKHTLVRTNAQQQRAMRAPGHPQNCIADRVHPRRPGRQAGHGPDASAPEEPAAKRPERGQERTALAGSPAAHDLRARSSEIAAADVQLEGQMASAGQDDRDVDQARHRHGPAHLGRTGRPQANECTVTITADGSVDWPALRRRTSAPASAP